MITGEDPRTWVNHLTHVSGSEQRKGNKMKTRLTTVDLAVNAIPFGIINGEYYDILFSIILSITFLGTGGFLVIRYKLFKMGVC